MHAAGRVEPGVPEGVDGWALAALAELTASPGVRRAGLALLEGGGRRLTFTASDRVGDPHARWCHVDAYDDVPLNSAVRTGSAVLGTLDQLHESYPAFVDGQSGTQTAAVAAVPITSAGQVLGGFVLYLDDVDGDAGDVEQELTDLGARLGRSLRRVQLAREPSSLRDRWGDEVAADTRIARYEGSRDLVEVRLSRRFLQDAMREWGFDDDTTGTAVLCLSELVTNAVVHGTGGCSVRVTDESGVLTVAVRNAGPAVPVPAAPVPTVEPDDPLEVHGRGLRLVATLSSRWGSELDASGVTVWFVLDP